MREHLRWLVVLAEEENVTAAAARLRMTQPTLSRALARLERTLGEPLFDRHGRRIALNESGRLYVEQVRRADLALATGDERLRERREGSRTVRLGFLHSFGTWLVPELVQETRERDPGIRFELIQDAADAISSQVAEGAVELGIVSPRPARTGLVWRRLLRQEVRVALPHEHPLASRSRIRLNELQDERFVAMAPGFGVRQLLEDACAAAGFAPNIAYECQELTTVAGLVAARAGVALLPEETEPRQPVGVTLLPFTGADTGRDIGLIWARGQPLSTAASRVRDLADDTAQASPLGRTATAKRGR